jgi:hypothetical protein
MALCQPVPGRNCTGALGPAVVCGAGRSWQALAELSLTSTMVQDDLLGAAVVTVMRK